VPREGSKLYREKFEAVLREGLKLYREGSWPKEFSSPTVLKKENQIFLIYKVIQNGAVAKSYMTNGLLIYGEKFAHFLIYVLGSPSSYMTLQLLHSEFPYI
jgi:hypothetical protein